MHLFPFPINALAESERQSVQSLPDRVTLMKPQRLARPRHYGKLGVKWAVIDVETHQSLTKLFVPSENTENTKLSTRYTQNMKMCHKQTHRNGNLEARNLVSGAITAPPPTDTDFLARKSHTFSVCVEKLLMYKTKKPQLAREYCTSQKYFVPHCNCVVGKKKKKITCATTAITFHFNSHLLGTSYYRSE